MTDPEPAAVSDQPRRDRFDTILVGILVVGFLFAALGVVAVQSARMAAEEAAAAAPATVEDDGAPAR